SNATGNVLGNDTDVDAGDTRSVTMARMHGDGEPQAIASGTSSSDGTVIQGLYGTLTLGADGSYDYVVDDNNAVVQALNEGETLLDSFDYLVTDAGGLSGLALLEITVHGSNDNPVAVDNLGVGYTAKVDTDAGTVIGTAYNPQG